MTAVLMIARAELRRAWRSFVVLGLLAGITGGVALAAVQVARRTSTAFERLEVAAGVPDVAVIATDGDGTAVAELPGVESAWILRQAVAKVEGESLVYTSVLAAEQPAPPGLFHPPLAEGRAPNPEAADEVVVSQNFRSFSGRTVGDTLDLAMLTEDEVHDFDTGFGEPDGPKITVKIVGVLRTALDTGTNTPQMYGTPAFARLIAPDATAATAVFVRLDDRVAGVPAFRAAVDGLPVPPAPAGKQEFAPYQVLVPSEQRSVVAVTARVLVIGLLVFAAIAALAGLLGVALALRRQILSRSVDPATMRALGADGGQIRFARIFAMMPFVAAGLAAAVAVLLLASGINPIGSLGRREPYPGWHLNLALTAIGLGALALVLVLIVVYASRRRPRLRRHRRHGALARLTAGAPPVVDVGAKFGLATGGGRNAVPVRSALVGTVIAIVGVVAVTVYAMSLTRTVEDPARWGWVVDAQIVDAKPAEFERLVADPRLESVTRLDESSVVLSGRPTNAMAFTPLRGLRTWTVLDGRLPERPGEVLLGARVRDNLDSGIGRIVTFEKRDGTKVPYRVVGVGTGPNTNNNQFARDVVVTPDALADIEVTEPFTAAAIVVAPGNDTAAVLADYARTLELSEPTRPVDVDNLAQLGALPELLIAFLAFVAIAVLAHLLTTLTRRRRVELDVLAAIGFLPRQVRRVVYVAALVMVGVGLLVGVPLGLLAGRTGWRVTADAIYVATGIASPFVALAILAASACVIALLVAAWPAWRVTRDTIAAGLRDE